MGRVSGDKSRYHRERRKKLARRERMRALRSTLEAKVAGTPEPQGAAAKSSSKTSAVVSGTV